MELSSLSFRGVSRLLLIILALTCHALAAPAAPAAKGNVTVTHYGETVFASEPHGRGTVGILISCTATFIFCIWTAVHPNIVPGCTTSQRLYYKAVLMVVSIMVPEGLLVCAIGEYRTANRVKKAWHDHPWPDEAKKNKMDMKVAFFIVMGGFFVDEANDPNEADPNRPYRAILTPTGFIEYMKKGLIDETSFENADVVDKGKASTFGKFLAGIQALWLVVDSATRWNAGLPLSLLEIHVLIHVVRTALIYGFWWRKPLDVNEPIRIRLKPAEGRGVSADPKTPELDVNSIASSTQPFVPDEFSTSPLGDQVSLEYHSKASMAYRPNEPDFITIQSPKTFIAFHNKAIYDIVIQVDVGERKDRPEIATGLFLQRALYESDTVGRSENTPKMFLMGGERTLILLGEALLVCLTGALHAAAWNEAFPTRTEKWLWRMSALAMIYCCLGIFLIANFTEYEQDLIAGLWKFHLRDPGVKKAFRYTMKELDSICLMHANNGIAVVDDAEKRSKRKTAKYALHQFAIWLGLCFAAFYFFSVLFITVESYLSIREVPIQMFKTASWTDYWPHL